MTMFTPNVQLDSDSRVVKCHGYGGYIRVKNWKVGVKSLGEHTVLKNLVLFLDI